MKTVVQKLATSYREVCSKCYVAILTNGNACLLVLGIALISLGLLDVASAQTTGGSRVTVNGLSTFNQSNYNDGLVRASVGNLFCLIEGAFGALIMVVAGLGAIVAAAMGAYRAAVGMLVVAVGAFILRSLVSLFFGTGYGGVGTACTGGGATGATN